MHEVNPQSESYLASVVAHAARLPCPARIAEALEYAVFRDGARVLPRLCLAVAQADGMPNPRLAVAAAGSIELLHCASLVHDDLHCFDNTDERREKASMHKVLVSEGVDAIPDCAGRASGSATSRQSANRELAAEIDRAESGLTRRRWKVT